MTALEDARAAQSVTHRYLDQRGNIEKEVRNYPLDALRLLKRADAALRALADEHERLTAIEPQREHFHVWSELPCKPGECRLTAPPTDSDREALAQLIQNAIDEGLGTNGWTRKPGPKERRAADAVLASDVWRNRRQAPVTDAQVEENTDHANGGRDE